MTPSIALLQRLQKQGLLSKEAAADVLQKREELLNAALAKQASILFRGLRQAPKVKKPLGLLERMKLPGRTPMRGAPEDAGGWSDVTMNLGKILALAGLTAGAATGASAGVTGLKTSVDEKKRQRAIESSFQSVKKMVASGRSGSPGAESATNLAPAAVRRTFDVLARYAPTLASDPVVAAEYVRHQAAEEGPFATHIQDLARTEQAVRRALEGDPTPTRKSSFNPVMLAQNLIS